MSRSSSVNNLGSAAKPLYRSNSNRALPSQRLSFPSEKDSNYVSNIGRRHYQNQSDRMIKLILPEKFALQNPVIPRERSLPVPHLIRHTSEKIHEINSMENIRLSPLKEESLRNKLTEQLDKMRFEIDKKKHSGLTHNSQTISIYNSPILDKKEPKKEVKQELISSKTPSFSFVLPANQKTNFPVNQFKNKSAVNPELRIQLEQRWQNRSKNPTHLSTALGII